MKFLGFDVVPGLGWVVVSFRVAAVLYLLLGGFLTVLLIIILLKSVENVDYSLFIVVSVVSFIMVVVTEVVIYGLRKKKFWAWVGAIMLSALYIPSIFLPLGVIALCGLLTKDVRKNYLH